MVAARAVLTGDGVCEFTLTCHVPRRTKPGMSLASRDSRVIELPVMLEGDNIVIMVMFGEHVFTLSNIYVCFKFLVYTGSELCDG